ncbi:hypothetical protein SELMODRAFT_430860 [Selaginella moellendorffii]|uniref:Uncharacterized protein n=1 Tax=Selaginella moellendorffii TaxID=88036 RepID=D8TAR6_SELML|nr:hypothetical protein SELMODRAFT_430860 [Selaginella moellendorffii]
MAQPPGIVALFPQRQFLKSAAEYKKKIEFDDPSNSIPPAWTTSNATTQRHSCCHELEVSRTNGVLGKRSNRMGYRPAPDGYCRNHASDALSASEWRRRESTDIGTGKNFLSGGYSSKYCECKL